jgi:hypothetical protein
LSPTEPHTEHPVHANRKHQVPHLHEPLRLTKLEWLQVHPMNIEALQQYQFRSRKVTDEVSISRMIKVIKLLIRQLICNIYRSDSLVFKLLAF